jgi:hypothetical protein
MYDQYDNEFNQYFEGIWNYIPFVEEAMTKSLMLMSILLFGGALSPHKIPTNVPRWIFPLITAALMIYPRLVEVYNTYKARIEMKSYAHEFVLLADRPPFK